VSHRIVVTGIGGLSSLGASAPVIWQAMKAGRCGIGPLTIGDRHDLKTPIGAQIDALPDHELSRRHLATMSRFGLLSVLAAGEALNQAGLDGDNAFDPHRAGAVIGTGVYGGDVVDQSYRTVFLEGKKRTDIFAVPKVMPSSPSVHVSMVHRLKGPVFGTTSACASSNHAIANALDLLRAGRADVIVAGGTDAPLTYGIIKAWESMRILAKTGCRPFSADREGLVLGDGAGALVLETEAHAKARNAPILAEIAGAGLCADAGDIVSPDPDGAARALRLCLADADLEPRDICYINAHGTGTMGNDKAETQAIRSVFGAHADALAVSATKAMHGHCLGASGAVEMIACIGAITDGIVPPTINLTQADPECDLDYVSQGAREVQVQAALSNSFAFGGANAVIAVKRYA
jgi:nodulation protein E